MTVRRSDTHSPARPSAATGHGLHVSGPLGELIGLFETLTAGPQVTVHVPGAGPGRERDLEPVGRIGDEFQPPTRHGPARLTRHRQNLFAAIRTVEADGTAGPL